MAKEQNAFDGVGWDDMTSPFKNQEPADGNEPAAQPGAGEAGQPPAEENGPDGSQTEAADTAPERPEQPEQAAQDAAAQLAGAQEKAERLEKQLAEMKDMLLRTAAEFDNFRKRSQREKDAAFGDGLAHAVAALLPVLDTLEMAANAQTADENYKKCVQMTLEKAAGVFAGLKVAEIEAQGKEFDPNLMNAVMQQPAPEGTQAGTVLQVLQKGYTYAGKVIRHAAVAVAE